MMNRSISGKSDCSYSHEHALQKSLRSCSLHLGHSRSSSASVMELEPSINREYMNSVLLPAKE